MNNAWEWHAACSDPKLLAAFAGDKRAGHKLRDQVGPNGETTFGFKLAWWAEWQTQCLLTGRVLRPEEVRRP